MTTASPWTRRYCARAAARRPPRASPGTWSLGSFIGGDELPGRLLEQVGAAVLTIGADGSLIEVQGAPCTSGQFDERLYEDWLVDVFSEDMQAFVDLEDRLFVFPTDGEPEVLVVFRRAE